MIEVEGLTKRFHEFTAVDRISFQVEKGDILGPNALDYCNQAANVSIYA